MVVFTTLSVQDAKLVDDESSVKLTDPAGEVDAELDGESLTVAVQESAELTAMVVAQLTVVTVVWRFTLRLNVPWPLEWSMSPG